jgi:hypothetical protein
MDDHQVNSIIATAICECSGDQAEHKIAPEQAKQMAKCIIQPSPTLACKSVYMTYKQMHQLRKPEWRQAGTVLTGKAWIMPID